MGPLKSRFAPGPRGPWGRWAPQKIASLRDACPDSPQMVCCTFYFMPGKPILGGSGHQIKGVADHFGGFWAWIPERSDFLKGPKGPKGPLGPERSGFFQGAQRPLQEKHSPAQRYPKVLCTFCKLSSHRAGHQACLLNVSPWPWMQPCGRFSFVAIAIPLYYVALKKYSQTLALCKDFALCELCARAVRFDCQTAAAASTMRKAPLCNSIF